MMNVLMVGGSDPSGASGVQRDIRVAWSMGMHPVTVVTAMTAQNTSEFAGVWPADPGAVDRQLDSILSDFEVSVAKVGMLWNEHICNVVADRLEGLDVPVILDPVVRSTTGGALLDATCRDALLERIIPLSSVVTPNASEAAYLTDMSISDLESASRSAHALYDMGASSAVITGVRSGNQISDVLYDGGVQHWTAPMHGTGHRGGGCMFSSVISCMMAMGNTIPDAVRAARDTVRESILHSHTPGRGRRVTAETPHSTLAVAVDRLCEIPHMYRLIPQCQTNFVHAMRDSISPDQVLGIQGRIVRTGDRVQRAGAITYGGSHHVASAVCSMRGRFPTLRSAVNIRFGADVLAALVREGLAVAFYDRTVEPEDNKMSGSSVAWGICSAISNASEAPDAICHRGDVGKEPMTILFGTDPDDVLSKLQRITPHLK